MLNTAMPRAIFCAIAAAWLSCAVWAQAPDNTGAAGTPAGTEVFSAAERDTYRLGAGDVVQITVWKEPAASAPAVTVRPDGKISMPLVKEVVVAGLTPAEAERVISEKLSRFIHGADVTVAVRETNSKKAYVIGAVKKEGPIALRYNMSVLQALAESGGVTDFAKRSRIYVLRTENGRQVRLPFRYDAVIKGQFMEQNILLRPEDTVVVPQ